MTQWYVKDLSKITGISTQALHHYDAKGLLKPSRVLANGYRVYSEKDLLRLQQIVALKFFGFELAKIKTLLSGDVDMIDHFTAQAKFLEEKAKAFLDASAALKNITSECKTDKPISWENIIKSIEVYRMTQELEHAWIAKVLNPAELKQYISYEESLKTRFTNEEKHSFEQKWMNVVKHIEANLDKDPKSDFGITMAKEVMDLVNGLYGKEHANLKFTIWEKGFKQGEFGAEHGMSPEVVQWIDKATQAYYGGRTKEIMQLSEVNPDKAAQLWQALMEEMYGNHSKELQEEHIDAVMESDASPAAKKWLQALSKR